MAAKSLVRSLRSQLVEQLRNEMLSGRYKAGDAIRQEEVVARYGVSRTPVREALIELEREGLVEIIPNCGARVTQEAPDAVREFLIPVRRVIEVFALRRGYDKITDDTFQNWNLVLKRMREACEAKDQGAVATADIAFHRSIIELAEEPSLLRIWSSIVSEVRAYFIACYAEYADLMSVYREHVTIVETFRRGDLEEATRYLSNRIGDPLYSALSEDLLRLQFDKDNAPPA